MNQPHDEPTNDVPRPWQPRFGLLSLMLVMLVCCMMSAAASYLYNDQITFVSPRVVFVFFTLMAPMMLVVVISIIRRLGALFGRSDRRQ